MSKMIRVGSMGMLFSFAALAVMVVGEAWAS